VATPENFFVTQKKVKNGFFQKMPKNNKKIMQMSKSLPEKPFFPSLFLTIMSPFFGKKRSIFFHKSLLIFHFHFCDFLCKILIKKMTKKRPYKL